LRLYEGSPAAGRRTPPVAGVGGTFKDFPMSLTIVLGELIK
jgi:hypothetical protein